MKEKPNTLAGCTYTASRKMSSANYSTARGESRISANKTEKELSLFIGPIFIQKLNLQIYPHTVLQFHIFSNNIGYVSQTMTQHKSLSLLNIRSSNKFYDISQKKFTLFY